MEKQKQKKDWLDQLKIIAEIVAIIAAIWFGQIISSSIKNRELSLKYVQMAAGILSTEPSEDTKYLRNWAVDIINEYSDIKLNEATKEELRKKRFILVQPTDDMVVSDDMIVTDEGFLIEVEE
jgi:hypothetical protein